MGAQCLDFLPYHFLLCSIGDGGVLRYQVTPIMPVRWAAFENIWVFPWQRLFNLMRSSLADASL